MTVAVDMAMGVNVAMAVTAPAMAVVAGGVAMDMAVRLGGNMDVGRVFVSQRHAGDHPDRDSDRQCFVAVGPSRCGHQHADEKWNQEEYAHPESPYPELPESIYGSNPAVYLDSPSGT